MRSASARGSRGGASKPVTPCSTSSLIPPMSEAITGIPLAMASLIVTGLFSGHTEGTTRTSIWS
jgi:hypothetical protein